MMCNRPINFNFKQILSAGVGIVAFAAVCLSSVGCKQNQSSRWAQTAPIIRADMSSGDHSVSLGVRK